jgi:hypothetical protein
VEFRLGRQDHNKVEDFLVREPGGVSAITLDTTAARHQQGAAEAAREAGVNVLFDPATERLADIGFELEGLSYYDGAPYDVNRLARDASARATLVGQVVEAQPETMTVITPPHFYVHDDRSANLNVALAEATLHETDRPVRATLVLARKYGETAAKRLATDYAQAGIRLLDLRVSPLGGDNESVAKIRSVFRLADTFRDAGMEVILGFSGNIGQSAVALGHVAHYSVGIGLREKVNHAEMISRQKTPPKLTDGDEGDRFGATAGIYLPGPAITLSRKAGAALLGNTDIRTRIGCRLGICGQSVAGPARDPREHYLHARAHEMNELLRRPEPWRPTAEMDRLRRALELRELINEHYLTADVRKLNTRTLRSLLDDIEVELAA